DLLRIQVTLIATVPDVQGHAARKSAAWVDIITRYAADRYRLPADALLPKVLGQCVWSAGWTALTYWAAGEELRPDDALGAAFAALRRGFARGLPGAPI
ncbi:MAG: hypothetical protein ACRYG2_27840, partial [Janthinobacterium lividum]